MKIILFNALERNSKGILSPLGLFAELEDFVNRTSVTRGGIEDRFSTAVLTLTGGWVAIVPTNDGWQCLMATFKSATAGVVVAEALDASYVMVA